MSPHQAPGVAASPKTLDVGIHRYKELDSKNEWANKCAEQADLKQLRSQS